MLKLPKGLKKKKKGKKSKRKGEEELFTEEELEKYRREHQKQEENGEGSAKENEEWSKFKDLTTGVDTVLKKTQGDLDRIKSTSFFQRKPVGPKELEPAKKEELHRPVVEVTEADFPQLLATKTDGDNGYKSDYGLTDEESEYEEDQDDIFDTSYVDAVERGEVKLAYVPDSPEEFQDDDIFDTSHVEALIKGQDVKYSKGKKGLDIGVAVEVLTGRIDNVTITTKRSKRVIPGDFLLESTDREVLSTATSSVTESVEKSILDLDTDIPIVAPIDLSVSLHTSLIQQPVRSVNQGESPIVPNEATVNNVSEAEIDEFTLLAAESLEIKSTITKLEENKIKVEPVLQESWSAFEADRNESVFAEGIVEDQLDVLDPYLEEDDPFDTSFADAVIPTPNLEHVKQEAILLEDDDDFDPRAEEIQVRLNNRRKSSVRIHLTNPSGIRESITSDDIIENDERHAQRDLLGGSTTDLTQLGDSPLDPVDLNAEIDPFDTTIVDKIVAPGKIELKLLEQELIGSNASVALYRVPSDPDFNPRADEITQQIERRASRPENLTVSKSVGFSVNDIDTSELDGKFKPVKPLTPYYTREISITEDLDDEAEAVDNVSEVLPRSRSDEDITTITTTSLKKRRHSEYPQTIQNIDNLYTSDLLNDNPNKIEVKVLTPIGPATKHTPLDLTSDPFDTSFASNIEPSKTELKLLAKEFSNENTICSDIDKETDLLETSDDIFQIKALTPEPSTIKVCQENFDPFDTSFANSLNPGRTEIKLLESEFID